MNFPQNIGVINVNNAEKLEELPMEFRKPGKKEKSVGLSSLKMSTPLELQQNCLEKVSAIKIGEKLEEMFVELQETGEQRTVCMLTQSKVPALQLSSLKLNKNCPEKVNLPQNLNHVENSGDSELNNNEKFQGKNEQVQKIGEEKKGLEFMQTNLLTIQQSPNQIP